RRRACDSQTVRSTSTLKLRGGVLSTVLGASLASACAPSGSAPCPPSAEAAVAEARPTPSKPPPRAPDLSRADDNVLALARLHGAPLTGEVDPEREIVFHWSGLVFDMPVEAPAATLAAPMAVDPPILRTEGFSVSRLVEVDGQRMLIRREALF